MHLRASYTPRRFGIAVNVHGDSSVLGLPVKHFFRFEQVTGLLGEALKRFSTAFLQSLPAKVPVPYILKHQLKTLPVYIYVYLNQQDMRVKRICNLSYLVRHFVTPDFPLSGRPRDGFRELQIGNSHFSKNVQI
jgi:hypothetical protein